MLITDEDVTFSQAYTALNGLNGFNGAGEMGKRLIGEYNTHFGKEYSHHAMKCAFVLGCKIKFLDLQTCVLNVDDLCLYQLE